MNRLCILTIAILGFLVTAQAEDVPLLPLVVKGDVKIGSSDAPIGTHVVAKLGGEILARGLVEREGYYVLTVPGDESLRLVEIQIYVNTVDSGQTIVWEEGGIIDLNLNVDSLGDQEPEDDPGNPDDEPEDVDDPPVDEPIDAPPDSEATPDEPTPEEGPEAPEEGGDVENPEAVEGAQGESEDPEASENTGQISDDVGDNSIVFILFVVIIAAVLVVTFILKKHSGGTKNETG